jgi:hypothetical protein
MDLTRFKSIQSQIDHSLIAGPRYKCRPSGNDRCVENTPIPDSITSLSSATMVKPVGSIIHPTLRHPFVRIITVNPVGVIVGPLCGRS